MRMAMLICGVAAMVATTTTGSATEYPLVFKSLTLEEAMTFPGGYGAYGSLSLRKPAGLKREPGATSTRPLYGELARTADGGGFAFRADESGGTGKGYDLLIVDLNQNGNLTDDPVSKLVGSPTSVKSGTRTREHCRFGPIPVPTSKRIGPGQPVYFAELYHYRNNDEETPRTDTLRILTTFQGQLRLKAGYYLEATVTLEGESRKVGVVDGNANLLLGDAPKPTTYKSASAENWYFQPADSFLLDTDRSGRFENRTADPESSPFGAVLYFGATPYRATLAKHCTSLRLEPWTEPLAILGLQPNGGQVREITLAREGKSGEWALIKAGVAQGQARVPAGKLRLTGCSLACDSTDGEPLVLAATYRKLDPTITARGGQVTPFQCGAPLEVRVTATKREATSTTAQLSTTGDGAAARGSVLQIRAEIVGAAGETYSTFTKGNGEPAKPQFAVVTQDGKTVTSGNLEFG